MSDVYDSGIGLPRLWTIPFSSITDGEVPWRDLTRLRLYAGLPSNRVRLKK